MAGFTAPTTDQDSPAAGGGFVAPATDSFVAPAGDAAPAPVPVNPALKGYLKDPAEDERAYTEAVERNKWLKPGLGSRFQDAVGVNIDRPIDGLISMLSGDGYEYGKAVNRYSDDLRNEQSNGPLGTATDFVGSVLTPSPIKGGGIMSQILEGGAQAMAEQRALATEGDDRTLLQDALSGATGMATTGVLAGAGKAISPGKTPAQVLEDARAPAGPQPGGEEAGNAFRNTVKKERTDLYKEGSKQIRKATKSGTEFSNAPGDRLKSFTANNYGKQRSGPDKQPIPISQEGTPAAYAFRQAIDELGTTNKDKMTLKDIDQLRVKARGLKKATANATDKAALADLEKTVDDFIGDSVSSKQFEGNPDDAEAFVNAYREGRTKVGKALALGDVKKLSSILNDESIPGSVIADELMKVTTNSPFKSASKTAKVLKENLGEGSPSLSSLRSGVLANLMHEGADPVKASAWIEKNPQFVKDFFTPEQAILLNKFSSDIKAGKLKEASESFNKASSIMENVSRSVGAFSGLGVGGAVGGGLGAAVGGTVGAGLGKYSYKTLASRPVRIGLSAATAGGAKAAGRYMADYMNDQEMAKKATIQELEK